MNIRKVGQVTLRFESVGDFMFLKIFVIGNR